MATLIPDFNKTQLSEIESRAEVKVYEAIRQGLPDDYYVFSQVAWILKNEKQQAKDGETDFVICHPNYGYLCIEVKGGGIMFEAVGEKWFSIDHLNQKNSIKNPIEQAKKAKYSILEKLKENPLWKAQGNKKINIGHAVFFPDIKEAAEFVRPDIDEVLIGTCNNLTAIKKWIDQCFAFWQKDDKSTTPIGTQGIQIFRDIFAKSFTIELLTSTHIDTEEKIRVKLTDQQVKVLDSLRKKRRQVISGGAGTGKTVIAVEKAKRLANEGFKTLLVCYNRPLANYLKMICENIENLDVKSFHQLCIYSIEKANKISGRNLLLEAKKTYPGMDEFDVQLPAAFTDSLDIVTDRYDAIVCDEGQDFREEFWVPLEFMLADDNNSPFYIFYDDNQNLYSRVSTFPIDDTDTFYLLKNCRNTIQIHKAAYKYYKGEAVEHSNIDGKELEYEAGINIEKQAVKIHSRILNLLDEKVDANKIVILIADAIHKNNYIEALKSHPLPKGIILTVEEETRTDGILITTVNRFKGLESEIAFLWGLNFIDIDEFREQVYVGISRAKSMTFIVGDKETCSKINDELNEIK